MNALVYALTANAPSFDATVFQNIDLSPLTTVASTIVGSVLPVVVMVLCYEVGVGFVKSIISKAR